MDNSRNPVVLHFVPVWLPQTQTWIHRQVAAVQQTGIDAHVVCGRRENSGQFAVNNMHCLAEEPKWRQFLDRGLRIFRPRRHLDYVVATGREIGAQVIHSHFGHIGWMNSGAVRKLGCRHVVTFYGLDVNKLPTQHPAWQRRYRELFAEADLILCEGSHMAKCIVALGCPAEKVTVQHLGVDVDRIDFAPRRWETGQPFKALIAASFREKKGIPYAVEALGLLNKEMQVRLTIIGDADQDRAGRREKKKILEALDRNGLSANARLLGYQPHAAIFREAYQHHVFLSPSVTAADGDTEGGAPVTLIEMAASGMPIVSTRHCDIPEIVEHGTTGYLAEERNAQELGGHLRRLVEHPERWGDMLVAGRRHVEREYDASKQGGKLAALYRSLVSR